MYKVVSRRRDGRVALRWLPSTAVTETPHLAQLRQQHLDAVGTERAMLIALVLAGQGEM